MSCAVSTRPPPTSPMLTGQETEPVKASVAAMEELTLQEGACPSCGEPYMATSPSRKRTRNFECGHDVCATCSQKGLKCPYCADDEGIPRLKRLPVPPSRPLPRPPPLYSSTGSTQFADPHMFHSRSKVKTNGHLILSTLLKDAERSDGMAPRPHTEIIRLPNGAFAPRLPLSPFAPPPSLPPPPPLVAPPTRPPRRPEKSTPSPTSPFQRSKSFVLDPNHQSEGSKSDRKRGSGFFRRRRSWLSPASPTRSGPLSFFSRVRASLFDSQPPKKEKTPPPAPIPLTTMGEETRPLQHTTLRSDQSGSSSSGRGTTHEDRCFYAASSLVSVPDGISCIGSVTRVDIVSGDSVCWTSSDDEDSVAKRLPGGHRGFPIEQRMSRVKRYSLVARSQRPHHHRLSHSSLQPRHLLSAERSSARGERYLSGSSLFWGEDPRLLGQEDRFSLRSCHLGLSPSRSEKSEDNAIPLEGLIRPLFFEVPQTEADPLFIGRDWLFHRLLEGLTRVSSSSPRARSPQGVALTGVDGTGKTSIILQLVDRSSFGRKRYGQPHRGSSLHWSTAERVLHGSHSSLGGVSSAASSVLSSSETLLTRRGTTHPSPSGTATPDHTSTAVPSASLSNLASAIVAFHFCQVDTSSTCFIPDFVHSLAGQMIQSPMLSPYRSYLLRHPELVQKLLLPACISNPADALVEGILQPLRKLRRMGLLRPPCFSTTRHVSASQTDLQEEPRAVRQSETEFFLIVVDGLCESDSHSSDDGQSIASFLRRHLHKFPDWLKLVVTVRNSKRHLIQGFCFEETCLDDCLSNPELTRDLMSYVTFRLRHSPSIHGNVTASTSTQHLANHLLQLCKGTGFLHAKMILDLLERGHLVIKANNYKILPRDLSEVFHLILTLRFRTASAFEQVHDILAVVLASLSPLTDEEIFNVACSSKETEISWAQFKERMACLRDVLIRLANGTHSLFHSSFRYWLMTRDRTPASNDSEVHFLVDTRRGHHLLASYLASQASLSPGRVLELTHYALKARQLTSWPVCAAWLRERGQQELSHALASPANVLYPNMTVSRVLLECGATPSALVAGVAEGDIPLICVAAARGLRPLLSLLLEYGARPNEADLQRFQSALHHAARSGDVAITRALVEAGADLTLLDDSNRCAMVVAAEEGHVAVIQILLAADWSGVNDLGCPEATQQAFCAAAEKGKLNVLEFLASLDAVDVDRVDSLRHVTPLVAAARGGHEGACRFLLSRGASVDPASPSRVDPTKEKEDDGKAAKSTALVEAAKHGNWEAANLLLSWGAPVDSRDVDLRTPLMHAAAEGHVGLVEFFIQKGTNVNCGDAEGQTALTLAAAKGRLSVTQWLVRSKAEVDVADHQGRTPLLHALENGKHAIVEFLLSNGATVECCDVSGFRPIDRAVEKGDLRMIELLLKKKGTLLKSTTWKLAEGKNDIIGLLLSKLLNDGRVLLKKGRLEESERRFRYALARMPTDTEDDESDEANLFRSTHVALLLQLAKVKEKMNDIEAAVKLLRDALELQPTNASVVKLLSSLNQREGGEGSSVTSSASRDQPLQSKEGATTQATARDGECPRLEVER